MWRCHTPHAAREAEASGERAASRARSLESGGARAGGGEWVAGVREGGKEGLCGGGRRLLAMSAIFDFRSLLVCGLLFVCTCTYVKARAPQLVSAKTGVRGLFWKAARIGERKSWLVAIACVAVALHTLLF